jgi:hypothetical protein
LELSLYRRLHNNLLPLSEQVKVTTAASNREKKTTRLLHVATREQRHRQSTPVAAPILDEVCETVGVTLKSFMAEVAMLNPELTEMVALFGAIDTSCKAIATLVRKSQLPSSEPHQAAVHDPREDQKKLDVIANEALKRALRFSGIPGGRCKGALPSFVRWRGGGEVASLTFLFLAHGSVCRIDTVSACTFQLTTRYYTVCSFDNSSI